MRVFRFGAELTGTGFFTTGLFVLPVVFALFGHHAEADIALDTADEVRVVYWEPPPSGGGRDVADASNQGDDPVETGEDATSEDPPELASSPVGTPIRRTASNTTSGRASAGTGGGSGGGSGAVRMRRPSGYGPTHAGSHPRGVTGPTCEPMVDGIVALDATSWAVERELVDEYAQLKRAKELVGWVDRHQGDDGRFDGVQVGGIACGSPLHLAGIRSGDVVHEVNGIEITGLVSALGAWRKLKKAEVLEVSLTRGGRKVNVTYFLG